MRTLDRFDVLVILLGIFLLAAMAVVVVVHS